MRSASSRQTGHLGGVRRPRVLCQKRQRETVMDSFELNKIIGAILGTLLFVMGVGFLADGIYAPSSTNGPTYDLPKPAAETATAATKAPPAVPLATLLAAADPKAGES